MEVLTFKQVEVGTRPCKDRKSFHAVPISLLPPPRNLSWSATAVGWCGALSIPTVVEAF
jgi:hypothetical protein